MKTCIASLFLYFLISSANAAVDVCFTPGEDCTSKIVEIINNAKTTVYVMAYSFTSEPILKALEHAENRGVQVEALLDKSDLTDNPNCIARVMQKAGFITYIDFLPYIAHNKVMIVDEGIVVTGSFNFTYNAQFRNAENVLLIHDKDIAKLYSLNWFKRRDVSKRVDDFNIE